ncbi:MAG: Uma2 family endonuclease [Candidatus Sumerlaeaceae bacterium]
MSTAPVQSQHFTYTDYLTWPEDERWELIDGVPYAMTPAPSSIHQLIAVETGRQLGNWLLDKPCKVFLSPIDVRLSSSTEADTKIDTVIQPDILVVCDPKKIDRRGILGVPDLIIEIISPSSSSMDEITKAALYERHGVREYWIVYPAERLVHVRLLGADGKFVSRHVAARGRIPVSILDGFEFDFDMVFQQIGDIDFGE